jgi:protein TonB
MRRRAAKGLGWPLGASAALHLLAAVALLAWPELLLRLEPPPIPPNQEATVEVVMGDSAEVNGVPAPPPAPAAQPAPPKPAPKAETPVPSPPPPPPPPPPQPETETPAPPPPPPPQPKVEAPAPPPPPPPQAQPKVEAPAPPPALPEKPSWDNHSVFGEGAVGATALIGDRLLPAVGEKGNIPPGYPPLSAQLGEQGIVVVQMQIAPDGFVTAVQLLQTSGYPRLDEAALAALKKWRFTPAVENGQPVSSVQVLPIRFRLD